MRGAEQGNYRVGIKANLENKHHLLNLLRTWMFFPSVMAASCIPRLEGGLGEIEQGKEHGGASGRTHFYKD